MAWVQNIKSALSCHSLPTRMWQTGRTLQLDPMVGDLIPGLGQWGGAAGCELPSLPGGWHKKVPSTEPRIEARRSFARTESAYAFE